MTGNKIVLWSYANLLPLAFMIFIILYDLFVDSDSTEMEKTFYSLSAFFIWIRIVHLMKLFQHTAYLLRMASEILFRMRWLIIFILMSLVAFGFTFFFLSDNFSLTPREGIEHMFFVLLGNYEPLEVHSIYQTVLFIVVAGFNFFFILTLLIALSVVAFDNESKEDSNEAYQERAAMIALYSYLLKEKALRDPHKNYLLIATVTEHKKFS